MKKEILDVWVKNLRSGRYKQAHGNLKTDNGFCCLGVLVDINYGAEAWDSSRGFESEFLSESFKKKYIENKLFIFSSKAVKILFNFADGEVSKCVNMNDFEKLNFNEIADWLEENIEVE